MSGHLSLAAQATTPSANTGGNSNYFNPRIAACSEWPSKLWGRASINMNTIQSLCQMLVHMVHMPAAYSACPQNGLEKGSWLVQNHEGSWLAQNHGQLWKIVVLPGHSRNFMATSLWGMQLIFGSTITWLINTQSHLHMHWSFKSTFSKIELRFHHKWSHLQN